MDVGSRIPHRWKIAGAIALAGAGATALVPFSNTVASLTDSEYAAGSFSYNATPWSIESSTDHSNTVPGTWTSHGTGNPATLSVQLPQLVPGRASYAPFALRVVAGSPSLSGNVTMGAGTQTSGTIANNVRMRTVVSPSGTCDATTFQGTPAYLVGQAANSTTNMLSAPNSGSNATVTAPTTAGQAGTATTLCFEFVLPAPTETAQNILDAFDSVNGKSTTVTWTFTGTSV